MHHHRFRRSIAGLAILGAVALAGTGCSSDSEGSSGSEGGSDTTAAVETVENAPDTITIAYQNIPNGDLIVKNQKLLEKALPDTKIEWKLFDSGGAVNEAITAGSIDFGLAGSSPVSRGLSTGIEYEVAWIHDVIGDAEALVVSPDSGIESVEDLAGKTIATPFASTAHYSLLAALDQAGVDPSTVDIIDAEPDDLYAAYSRGDIDGGYVWNPNLAKAVADGGTIIVTSAELAEEGDTTYDLGVVATEFADEYPEAVEAWVEAQDQAVGLLNEDPDAAAEIIASELDIEADEALAQIGDLIFVSAADQAGEDYLGGKVASDLFTAAQFNLDQGEIDEVKPEADYEAGVDSSFAEKAAG